MMARGKNTGTSHIETVDGFLRVSYEGYLTGENANEILEEVYKYAHVQQFKTK